jgi:hypothetical protein
METPEGKVNKDVKRTIHVGDFVLDSLEAIRTNILSGFHPREEQAHAGLGHRALVDHRQHDGQGREERLALPPYVRSLSSSD